MLEDLLSNWIPWNFPLYGIILLFVLIFWRKWIELLLFSVVNTKDKKKMEKQQPQATTVVADTSHFRCKEEIGRDH